MSLASELRFQLQKVNNPSFPKPELRSTSFANIILIKVNHKGKDATQIWHKYVRKTRYKQSDPKCRKHFGIRLITRTWDRVNGQWKSINILECISILVINRKKKMWIKICVWYIELECLHSKLIGAENGINLTEKEISNSM